MTSNLPGKKMLIVIILVLVQVGTFVWADNLSIEIDTILSSAESLFKSMYNRDYPRIWQFLSAKSRNKIVDDTIKAAGMSGGKSSGELIYKDFAGGDKLSKSYWDAYLSNFDPNTILEQSKWEMQSIKKETAEIRITHKKAFAPTVLLMFKENGMWKVGLVETFGTGK